MNAVADNLLDPTAVPIDDYVDVIPKSQNGALYFPYLLSTDPVTDTTTAIAPSGFVAGIYARTDANRGVWKAPAGIETTVLNTGGPVPTGVMNDPQQGVLNVDAINALRTFNAIGTVVFGSRTLVGADANTAFPQSKYVPVRRMTLFIEQSLVANLKWVVFEPNAEPLWIAIRATIESFLLSLFNQGALAGTKPSEAFQVKVDSTTTTPQDQQNGIVNIVVAFAPLRPAEFVVLKIAQLAGQAAGA
jgi:phage tail sheath protein FI